MVELVLDGLHLTSLELRELELTPAFRCGGEG